MKKLFPALLSASIACVTLATALAMAPLQEPASSKAAPTKDGATSKPDEAAAGGEDL